MAQEASVGRQRDLGRASVKFLVDGKKKCGTGKYRKTPAMRFTSGVLGSCCLTLLISTLVASACFENLNNADIIPDNYRLIFKTIFYIMDVGMYGQLFTTFLHIAIEKSSQDQGHNTDGGQTKPRPDNPYKFFFSEWCPNLGRGCKLLASGVGFLLVAYVFVLSAVFVLEPGDGDFVYVSAIQIALHSLIILVVLFLLCLKWKNSTLARTGTECCSKLEESNELEEDNKPKECFSKLKECCSKLMEWLLLEDPERLIYILYFLGALTFNIFSYVTYRMHGDDIHIPHTKFNNETDERRLAMGTAETVFGFVSTIFQFLVVLIIKLLHAGHSTTHPSLQGVKTVLLKSLLVVSVSLAAADIMREDFDKDEKVFRNHSKLIPIFDSFYPIVVDFRLHSAIMVLCMVWEDHVEKKTRRDEERKLKKEPERCDKERTSRRAVSLP